MPSVACGVNDTGIGLLHTIPLSYSANGGDCLGTTIVRFHLVVYTSTSRLMTAMREHGGARVLSVDDTGLSPIYACLAKGHSQGPQRFFLANKMLQEILLEPFLYPPPRGSSPTKMAVMAV